MAYFPFFVDLAGRSGLIVGGGAVALRKAEKLLPYGPALTVAAPELCPELRALPGLTLVERPFRPSDLEGMAFVVAASGDRAVNRQVSELCKSKHIPVNAVDDRENCTFLFPALVERGSLTVGVTTGGASPTAAAWVREQVDGLLPQELGGILAWMEALRPALKAEISGEERRAALFARLFAAALASGGPLSREETERICGEGAP